MIKEFILMWVKFYPILSIIIFVMFITSSNWNKSNNSEDAIEMLKSIQDDIEEIRFLSPKVAEIVEYVLEEMFNGNKVPVLMITLFFSYVPFFRLSLLKLALFNK